MLRKKRIHQLIFIQYFILRVSILIVSMCEFSENIVYLYLFLLAFELVIRYGSEEPSFLTYTECLVKLAVTWVKAQNFQNPEF